MTSLAVQSGRSQGVSAPPQAAGQAQAIRAGLHQMAAALEPFRAWRSIAGPPSGADSWGILVRRLTPRPSFPLEALIEARVAAALSRWPEPEDEPAVYRRALVLIPPEAELKRVGRLARSALDAPPSETATSQAVGALVEAYLPGRANAPIVYAETLIDLSYRDGFPPAIVAEARERLLRSDSKFAPTPGEFIAACETARADLDYAARITADGIAARATATEILRRIDLHPNGRSGRTDPSQPERNA